MGQDISEVEKVINIQDFIEQSNDYIDLGILMKHAQRLNIWDAFRRNYMIIRDLANNHNAKISAKYYHNEDSLYYKSINMQNDASLHNEKL